MHSCFAVFNLYNLHFKLQQSNSISKNLLPDEAEHLFVQCVVFKWSNPTMLNWAALLPSKIHPLIKENNCKVLDTWKILQDSSALIPELWFLDPPVGCDSVFVSFVTQGKKKLCASMEGTTAQSPLYPHALAFKSGSSLYVWASIWKLLGWWNLDVPLNWLTIALTQIGHFRIKFSLQPRSWNCCFCNKAILLAQGDCLLLQLRCLIYGINDKKEKRNVTCKCVLSVDDQSLWHIKP